MTYEHGQSPSAQLRKADARVNFLEHELDRLRRQKLRRNNQWTARATPSFDSPEFKAEYERERAWAAHRWPEPVTVKDTRLALLVAEAYRPPTRHAA